MNLEYLVQFFILLYKTNLNMAVFKPTTMHTFVYILFFFVVFDIWVAREPLPEFVPSMNDFGNQSGPGNVEDMALNVSREVTVSAQFRRLGESDWSNRSRVRIECSHENHSQAWGGDAYFPGDGNTCPQ